MFFFLMCVFFVSECDVLCGEICGDTLIIPIISVYLAMLPLQDAIVTGKIMIYTHEVLSGWWLNQPI